MMSWKTATIQKSIARSFKFKHKEIINWNGTVKSNNNHSWNQKPQLQPVTQGPWSHQLRINKTARTTNWSVQIPEWMHNCQCKRSFRLWPQFNNTAGNNGEKRIVTKYLTTSVAQPFNSIKITTCNVRQHEVVSSVTMNSFKKPLDITGQKITQMSELSDAQLPSISCTATINILHSYHRYRAQLPSISCTITIDIVHSYHRYRAQLTSVSCTATIDIVHSYHRYRA